MFNIEKAKAVAKLRHHNTDYEKFDEYFHVDGWGLKKRRALNYKIGEFNDGLISFDEFNEDVDNIISSVNLNRWSNQQLFIQEKMNELHKSYPDASKSAIKNMARKILAKILATQLNRNERRKKRVKIYFQ